MEDFPNADLTSLPVVDIPEELDADSKNLISALNRLQKEVKEGKNAPVPNNTPVTKTVPKTTLKRTKIQTATKLNKEIDAAIEDDGVLAGHREERRKLAERLENDPKFRQEYEEKLAEKNLADSREDNIVPPNDGEYFDALATELNDEDLAALGEIEELTEEDIAELGASKASKNKSKQETVDVAKMLEGMHIVFQNVTTVNIYTCKCHAAK